MRILGIDFETAGTKKMGHFRAVEVGLAIYNTENKRLERSFGYLVNDLIASNNEVLRIPEEVTKIHHLTTEDVIDSGISPLSFLADLTLCLQSEIDAVMVWNGYFFDQELLREMIARHLDTSSQLMNIFAFPWIDLKLDTDFKYRLDHEAADRGILSAYPHMALADVITMFRLFQSSGLQIDNLIYLAKDSMKVVFANVDYHNRDIPKSHGFKWSAQHKKWWKVVRPRSFNNLEWFNFPHTIIEANGDLIDSLQGF